MGIALEQANPRPYKVYSALISQVDDSNPTEIILENTIGVEPNSWVRDSGGYYRLSPSTSGLFKQNKTLVFTANSDATGSPEAELSTNITSKLSTPDQVYIFTYNSSGGADDNILKECSIEIRVYN